MDLKTKIKDLPIGPGVYLFKDDQGQILYVGKASSLRDRVKSYFGSDLEVSRSSWIVKMISQVVDVEVIETDSALEALISEASLIKELQPQFNSRDKDNKSFNYCVITDEDFPRVLVKRGRDLTRGDLTFKYIFGPFPSGNSLKEALRIIRKIFPFRDRCRPQTELKDPAKARPCFNVSLGLCPGVCCGRIDRTLYRRQIRHIVKFLRGEKRSLVTKLEKEMLSLAKDQRFEEAQVVKGQIYALTHIQDVSLLKKDWLDDPVAGNQSRLEAFDVAHMSGRSMVGVMAVMIDGQIDRSEFRKFKLKTVTGSNDVAALTEIVSRRLKHDQWPRPDLVVVDGGQAQKTAIERVINNAGWAVPVVAVVKDERHRPKGILGPADLVGRLKGQILEINSESHRSAIGYHRRLLRKQQLS